MSLPVVSGRAPARPPVIVEPPRADQAGSPADIMRAVGALKADIRRSEAELIEFWARLLDFLMEAASDAIIDKRRTGIGAPMLGASGNGQKPTLGGHRLPAKSKLMIRRIEPRPDPVSAADVMAAVEQLRTNLALQLKQAAAADQHRAQTMADMLHAAFGGE